MIRLWLKRVFVGHSGRLVGSAVGLALPVALLASLGTFVVASSEGMAHRAVASLPVDWQVLLVPGADPAPVIEAIGKAARYNSLRSVGYADTEGFSATTGETSQATGPGKVLGLEADYRRIFPGQIELNLGSWDGVLAASQTAANLHIAPGDTVTIRRVGQGPVDVKIAGVVALPNADLMFQAIGVSKNLAPQAPPDNVLLMPMQQWQAIFGPQSSARPDTVRTEIHVRVDRGILPPDPSAAFIQAQRAPNNFEARVAGSAALTDNLAAQLDAVRADALYARVLFLFLGIPGVVLALLVTLAVASSGSERRRREQALLRLRGASRPQVLRLAAIEATAIGGLGVTVGPCRHDNARLVAVGRFARCRAVADPCGRRRVGLWHCGVHCSSMGGCDENVDFRRPCRGRPTSIAAVATTICGHCHPCRGRNRLLVSRKVRL
jgi:putative ABC transport system permease protein